MRQGFPIDTDKFYLFICFRRYPLLLNNFYISLSHECDVVEEDARFIKFFFVNKTFSLTFKIPLDVSFLHCDVNIKRTIGGEKKKLFPRKIILKINIYAIFLFFDDVIQCVLFIYLFII